MSLRTFGLLFVVTGTGFVPPPALSSYRGFSKRLRREDISLGRVSPLFFPLPSVRSLCFRVGFSRRLRPRAAYRTRYFPPRAVSSRAASWADTGLSAFLLQPQPYYLIWKNNFRHYSGGIQGIGTAAGKRRGQGAAGPRSRDRPCSDPERTPRFSSSGHGAGAS